MTEIDLFINYFSNFTQHQCPKTRFTIVLIPILLLVYKGLTQNSVAPSIEWCLLCQYQELEIIVNVLIKNRIDPILSQ